MHADSLTTSKAGFHGLLPPALRRSRSAGFAVSRPKRRRASRTSRRVAADLAPKKAKKGKG